MIDYKFFLIFTLCLLINCILFIFVRNNQLIAIKHYKYLNIQQIHNSSDVHLRIGWLFILFNSILICFFYESYFFNNFLIILLPIFFIGFFYDLFLSNDVFFRFLLLSVISALATNYLFFELPDLNNLFGIDTTLFFKITFYFFCFLVLMNGYNFIDGSNGLIIFYTLFISLSLVFVSIFYLNSYWIENIYLNLISLFIVLLFNYPRGIVFMGDAGAYLLAILSSILTIKFVTSTTTNYWFLVSIFFLPAFEVLFSVSRKILESKNPLQADNKHMHHLIYAWLSDHYPNLSTLAINNIIVIFYTPFFIFFCINSFYFFNEHVTFFIISIQLFYYLLIYRLLK